MCTGNQARSVLAEHYMRKITSGRPVDIESVGLMDITGAPALREAIDAGRSFSLDLSTHKSRPFTTVDLAGADLVVGFEQRHVAAAVVEGGAPQDKTFKLLELVRLTEGSWESGVASDPRAAIARAHLVRASSPRFEPGDELADPAGRNAKFFRRTAGEIKSACDRLAGVLFPRPIPESNVPLEDDAAARARIWE